MRFQKKARSKEIRYFSEGTRASIAKPKQVKGICLLPRTFKENYAGNKLDRQKCLISWKKKPKLFNLHRLSLFLERLRDSFDVVWFHNACPCSFWKIMEFPRPRFFCKCFLVLEKILLHFLDKKKHFYQTQIRSKTGYLGSLTQAQLQLFW